MLAILALLTASVIWGATAPVMKWTLEVIPPFTLAFLRFSLASLILTPLLWRFRKIEIVNFWKIVAASFLGITANIAFFFFGLKLTFAINAALIIATIPIFTLAAASLFLKEKISSKLVLSAILAFSGLILLIGPPIVSFGLVHLLGTILLLTAALSWVGFEVVSKKLFAVYSPFTLIFHITWIGAVSFAPIAAFELILAPAPILTFNKQMIVGVLFGAIFSSTIAYTAWQWGLSKLKTSEAGMFLYLEPISGILVSIKLLGETITPLFAIGAILVILGVFLAEQKRKEHPLHQSRPEVTTKQDFPRA